MEALLRYYYNFFVFNKLLTLVKTLQKIYILYIPINILLIFHHKFTFNIFSDIKRTKRYRTIN